MFKLGNTNEKIAAKIAPHLLADGQKQSRLNACCELNEEMEVDSDLFSKVIIGKEIWCYG